MLVKGRKRRAVIKERAGESWNDRREKISYPGRRIEKEGKEKKRRKEVTWREVGMCEKREEGKGEKKRYV